MPSKERLVQSNTAVQTLEVDYKLGDIIASGTFIVVITGNHKYCKDLVPENYSSALELWRRELTLPVLSCDCFIMVKYFKFLLHLLLS